LAFEGALLALTLALPAFIAGWEVWRNQYLPLGLPRAASRIFSARYLDWFTIAAVGLHTFGLLAFAASRWLRTWRRSLVFAALSLGFTAAVNYGLVRLVVELTIRHIERFEALVHRVPVAAQDQLHENSRLLLEPMAAGVSTAFKLLDLSPGPILVAIGVQLALGVLLAAAAFRLTRRWRRRPADGAVSLRRILLFPRRAAGWVVVGLLLVVAVVVAAAPRSRYATDGPNIVFISIDTLRADHVSAYGYSLATTPAIDRIAAEGLLFERAVSQSSWTLPSHMSMLTGLYPIEHGCEAVQGTTLSPRIVTLPEVLLEHGYRTVAVTGGHFLSEAFEFDQGFEQFFYRQTTADHLATRAKRLIEAAKDEKFFLFFHVLDPHDPYTPPAAYREMFAGRALPDSAGEVDHALLQAGENPYGSEALATLRQLYDGEIRFADDQVARLLDTLRELGLLDRTIVLITSDHGESFGENNEMVHGTALTSQQIHVPFILRYPPKLAGGRRVPDIVEASVQAMPTLLDLAGITYPFKRPSVLAQRDTGAFPHGPPAFSETALSRRPLYAVLNERWKLVVPRAGDQLARHEAALYDVARDWQDSQNLASANPETLHRYADLIGLYLQSGLAQRGPQGGKVNLSPLEIEQLRSLGYIR
jgi:arylsulfatase A-like enzyme